MAGRPARPRFLTPPRPPRPATPPTLITARSATPPPARARPAHQRMHLRAPASPGPAGRASPCTPMAHLRCPIGSRPLVPAARASNPSPAPANSAPRAPAPPAAPPDPCVTLRGRSTSHTHPTVTKIHYPVAKSVVFAENAARKPWTQDPAASPARCTTPFASPAAEAPSDAPPAGYFACWFSPRGRRRRYRPDREPRATHARSPAPKAPPQSTAPPARPDKHGPPTPSARSST